MTRLSFFLLPLLCSCLSRSNEAPAPVQEPALLTGDPRASEGAHDGGSPDITAPASSADVVASRLENWLLGKFDSKDQSLADPTYFAISLTTCRVELPSLGERVLYIEQARLGGAPYRQRLYVIEGVDATTARSRVFEANDPRPLVGLCGAAQPPTLAASDFAERMGCSVEMHWTEDRFEGHTPDARWTGSEFVADPTGQRCPSSLYGASFATSEVRLDRDRLRSWDRGFDANSVQVWGATQGGYEFVRRTPLPQP